MTNSTLTHEITRKQAYENFDFYTKTGPTKMYSQRVIGSGVIGAEITAIRKEGRKYIATGASGNEFALTPKDKITLRGAGRI